MCVCRYGHQWYEIRIDTLSDLTASEETIRTADRELSLLDYIVQQCERPIPAELAALPNDAAVVRYRLMDRWLEEEVSDFDRNTLVYESAAADRQKERASA